MIAKIDLKKDVGGVCQKAKQASYLMASLSTQKKNEALVSIAEGLVESTDFLCQANDRDIQNAQSNALPVAVMDRLLLSPSVIKKMADGIHQMVLLKDPVGEVTDLCFQPSGIQVGKMRVPLGVVAMVYEARPNVTADAAALCLKSGNAIVLRGGSSAFHSNQAIIDCLKKALIKAKLPESAIQMINTTDRMALDYLVQMPEYVDIAVIRGGKGLIKAVCEKAQVPLVKHLEGICHVYIDAFAEPQKALAIALNAKTQRHSTCNTMETLLIEQNIASTLLCPLAKLYEKEGVQLRGCKKTCALLGRSVTLATQEDWSTEYLSPILSIRIVTSLSQAIDHINTFGSHHTDSIVTENYGHAQRFLKEVDSASVMVNASTRLSDGFEYGLGAEIGISTDKIHARGPVGLEGLTSQKWIVLGDGHLRN